MQQASKGLFSWLGHSLGGVEEEDDVSPLAPTHSPLL